MTANPCDLTRVRQTRNQLTGDPGPADELVLRGCVWAPAGTQDPSPRAQLGEQTVSRRDVFIPDVVELDVVSTDRMRFPGETGAPWLVAGDVEVWAPPWDDGGPGGAKFTIERTTG